MLIFGIMLLKQIQAVINSNHQTSLIILLQTFITLSPQSDGIITSVIAAHICFRLSCKFQSTLNHCSSLFQLEWVKVARSQARTYRRGNDEAIWAPDFILKALYDNRDKCNGVIVI